MALRMQLLFAWLRSWRHYSLLRYLHHLHWLHAWRNSNCGSLPGRHHLRDHSRFHCCHLGLTISRVIFFSLPGFNSWIRDFCESKARKTWMRTDEKRSSISKCVQAFAAFYIFCFSFYLTGSVLKLCVLDCVKNSGWRGWPHPPAHWDHSISASHPRPHCDAPSRRQRDCWCLQVSCHVQIRWCLHSFFLVKIWSLNCLCRGILLEIKGVE